MDRRKIIQLIFIFFLGCSSQMMSSLNSSHRSIASEEKYCLRIVSKLLETSIQTYSYKGRITLHNFDKVGKELFSNLRGYLSKNGKSQLSDKLLIYEEILVDDFFRHSFQNTVQHGSEELVKKGPNLDQVFTDIIVTTFISEKGITFEIVNPQIKYFPESLNKRFYQNDIVKIPAGEREGFKGANIGHESLIEDLRHLPESSYIEWSSDGESVKFILFVSFIN